MIVNALWVLRAKPSLGGLAHKILDLIADPSFDLTCFGIGYVTIISAGCGEGQLANVIFQGNIVTDKTADQGLMSYNDDNELQAFFAIIILLAERFARLFPCEKKINPLWIQGGYFDGFRSHSTTAR